MDINPLLNSLDSPPYALIQLEHLQPAIEQIIDDNRLALRAIIDDQTGLPTWDDLVAAVNSLDARLNNCLNLIIPLHTRGSEWNSAVEACYLATKAYHVEKLQNAELYGLYQRLERSDFARNFSAPRKVALQQALKAFRLAGAHLPEATRARLAQLQAEVLECELEYVGNLEVANQRGVLVADETRLAGIAEDDKQRMARNAQARGEPGWLLALDDEDCRTVLGDADDASLRAEYYRAWHTRASEQDQGPDNTPVLARLTQLRHEWAQLLGFADYVHLSLQTKTVEAPDQVEAFLDNLLAQLQPRLQQDLARLRACAGEQGASLQPWDIAYYQRRSCQQDTLLSADAFKAYFALDQVMASLLALVETLFEVKLERNAGLSAWHPDVEVYEVHLHHALLGYLYVDVLAREGKGNADWSLRMFNPHSDAEGIYQKGAAALFGNVAPAQGDSTPLLSHLQLCKLYHEFAHCLHALLVRSGDYRLADLDSLGPDGLEFPAELVEQWCWSARYLAGISRHHQHGTALSEAQVQGFLDGARREKVLGLGRQLALAMLDMRLHTGPGTTGSVQQAAQEVFDRVMPGAIAAFERPTGSFDHLATGYAAGYYSYLWSSVHALDAFECFEQEGLLNPATGKRLRDKVFAPGAQQSMVTGFEAFRGRPLSARAFLRWHGLESSRSTSGR